MWFQQTLKKSQGELLAYIYRERGKERENRAEKKETKGDRDRVRKIACTVCGCVYKLCSINPFQTSLSWTADVQPDFSLVVIRC